VTPEGNSGKGAKGKREGKAERQKAKAPAKNLLGTLTQSFKANPGLELANAFSVSVIRIFKELSNSSLYPFPFSPVPLSVRTPTSELNGAGC